MGIIKVIFFILLIYVVFKLLKYMFFLWLFNKARKSGKTGFKNKKEEGETNVFYVPEHGSKTKKDRHDDEYITFHSVNEKDTSPDNTTEA